LSHRIFFAEHAFGRATTLSSVQELSLIPWSYVHPATEPLAGPRVASNVMARSGGLQQQTAPESEKAQRYLQALDEARCAGRWQDVPELCRKVEKHAPHRKCAHTAKLDRGSEG
jgi:hypothetical protein